MVVWLTMKVKQAVLTAVCRRQLTRPRRVRGGLLIQGVAALDPGGGAAVDVAYVGVAEMHEVAGRRQAALPAVADSKDRSIAWDLVDPLLQLRQRDQLRAGNVTLLILPGLPNIQQEAPRLVRQPLPEPLDVDGWDSRHQRILSASFTGYCSSFSTA